MLPIFKLDMIVHMFNVPIKTWPGQHPIHFTMRKINEHHFVSVWVENELLCSKLFYILVETVLHFGGNSFTLWREQ